LLAHGQLAEGEKLTVKVMQGCLRRAKETNPQIKIGSNKEEVMNNLLRLCCRAADTLSEPTGGIDTGMPIMGLTTLVEGEGLRSLVDVQQTEETENVQCTQ